MTFVARKPMTLLGVKYAARAVVDLDRVKPAVRRRLVEQRRVVPRVVEASAAAVPENATSVDIDGSHNAERVMTCGDHGGTTARGTPCKVPTDRLCGKHAPKEA